MPDTPNATSNNEALEQTPEIVMIATGDLYVPDWNPRKYVNEGELQKLITHRKNGGKVPPILLWKGPGISPWAIISGQRRWLADKRLGKTHIPAIILDITLDEAKNLAFASNEDNKPHWLDWVIGVETRYNEQPQKSQDKLGEQLGGLTGARVNYALKVAKALTPTSRGLIVKSLNDGGPEKAGNETAVLALANLLTPEQVEIALPVFLEKEMTVSQAKSLANHIKAGNPPETFGSAPKTPKQPKPKPATGPSPEAIAKAVELAKAVGMAEGRGEDTKPSQDLLDAHLAEIKTAPASSEPQTFKVTSPEGFALLKQKVGDIAKEVFKPAPTKHESVLEKEAQKGLKWSEKFIHWFVKHVWHGFLKYEHRICKAFAKEVIPEHYTHSGHKRASRGIVKDFTTLALTLLHWAVYAVCQFVFWWGLPTWALSRFLPSLKPWFEWPFRFAVRQVLAFPPWAWVWGTNHLFPALVLLAVVLVLISLAARVEPMRMTLLGVLLASTLYYGPRWANVPSPWSQTTEEVSTPVPQSTPVMDEVKKLVSISKPKEKTKSTSAPVVAYQPSMSFAPPSAPTQTLYDPKLLEQEIAALPKNCIVKAFPVLTDEGMPGDLAVSRMQGVTDPDKYTMMLGSGKQQIQSINTTTTNLIVNYKSTDPFNMFNGPGQLNYFWEDVLYIHTDEIDVEDKIPYQIYQLSLVVSGSKYALTLQCASQADLKHLVSTMQYFIRNSRLGHDTALAGMPYPHQGLVLNNDCVVEKLWAESPMDKAAVSLGDHFWSIGKLAYQKQSRSDLEAGLSALPVTFFYATASEWDRAMKARNPNVANTFRPRLRKVVLPAL